MFWCKEFILAIPNLLFSILVYSFFFAVPTVHIQKL